MCYDIAHLMLNFTWDIMLRFEKNQNFQFSVQKKCSAYEAKFTTCYQYGNIYLFGTQLPFIAKVQLFSAVSTCSSCESCHVRPYSNSVYTASTASLYGIRIRSRRHIWHEETAWTCGKRQDQNSERAKICPHKILNGLKSARSEFCAGSYYKNGQVTTYQGSKFLPGQRSRQDSTKWWQHWKT